MTCQFFTRDDTSFLALTSQDELQARSLVILKNIIFALPETSKLRVIQIDKSGIDPNTPIRTLTLTWQEKESAMLNLLRPWAEFDKSHNQGH